MREDVKAPVPIVAQTSTSRLPNAGIERPAGRGLLRIIHRATSARPTAVREVIARRGDIRLLDGGSGSTPARWSRIYLLEHTAIPAPSDVQSALDQRQIFRPRLPRMQNQRKASDTPLFLPSPPTSS